MFKNLCPNDWLANEEKYLQALEDPEQWISIPLLNVLPLDHLTENTLVRFQGMVQDMFNPEYFFERFEVKNQSTGNIVMKNGKYFDSSVLEDSESVNFHSKNNITKERHTLALITVPGTNKWVENFHEEKNKQFVLGHEINAVTNQMAKRTLDSDDAPENADNSENSATPETNETNKKQCTSNSNVNKSQQENADKKAAVNLDDILNFPLSERKGKVCHAKIYKDADSIKLNDVIEIVGFLSFSNEKPVANPAEEIQAETDFANNPPASLVPRVHCVTYRKLVHINPLVDEKGSINSEQREFLRKDLHIVLTQLMLGDELAAQYLLFNLISRIFGRVSLEPLGKFSLNISNVPSTVRPDYVKEVYEFLEMLMPISHYFAMTLDNMNKTMYIPQKNYETDCLKSGLLQLSNQTQLVLDETQLKDGTLQAMGVLGVQNIKKTIETQTVTYDFGYYPMEFETDIPFLIFSEGKTMLSCDFQVKLNYDQEIVDTFNEVLVAAKHFVMKPEFLTNVRKYLTTIRHADYDVTDNMLEKVQNDYVEMRKSKLVTGEDLQRLLVVARYISLASGNEKLDEESWNKACDFEKRRKETLKSK